MQQANSDLLRAKDLTKIFYLRQGFSSTEFHAVDAANFTIDAQKPEIFAIVGESGSGKTTLSRMILGMDAPEEGSLSYKGRSVPTLTKRDKKTGFTRKFSRFFKTLSRRSVR